MRWAMLALLVAAGDEFKYSEWDAWNGFREGSSVTFEVEVAGVKMRQTTTILRKESDRITLEDVVEMASTKMPGKSRTVEKSKGGTEAASCPKCGKAAREHRKPESKEAKEKFRVGEKELDGVRVDTTLYGCDGAESLVAKTWYSKEVPGWIVRMEAVSGASAARQGCVAYEKK